MLSARVVIFYLFPTVGGFVSQNIPTGGCVTAGLNECNSLQLRFIQMTSKDVRVSDINWAVVMINSMSIAS